MVKMKGGVKKEETAIDLRVMEYRHILKRVAENMDPSFGGSGSGQKQSQRRQLM